MLPGFRFLFAAIALSVSMLVFGLGAAALLRAAHERFVSVPSMRAPPGPMFARQTEAPAPTLSLLRVEAAVSEPKVLDLQASLTPPSREPTALPEIAPPVETATPMQERKPSEADKAAVPATNAPTAEQPAPTESQQSEPVKLEPKKSEPANPEPPVQTVASAEPAVAASAASAGAPSIGPASFDLTKLAMVAEPTPAEPSEPYAVTQPLPNAPLPSPRPADASTRTASRGETAATTETTPPKQIIRKRAQVRRVVKRSKKVARARIARPSAAQPAANPFGG